MSPESFAFGPLANRDPRGHPHAWRDQHAEYFLHSQAQGMFHQERRAPLAFGLGGIVIRRAASLWGKDLPPVGAGIEFRSQSTNPDFDLKPHLHLIDFSHPSTSKNHNKFSYGPITSNLSLRAVRSTFYTSPPSYARCRSEFLEKGALLSRVGWERLENKTPNLLRGGR